MKTLLYGVVLFIVLMLTVSCKVPFEANSTVIADIDDTQSAASKHIQTANDEWAKFDQSAKEKAQAVSSE